MVMSTAGALAEPTAPHTAVRVIESSARPRRRSASMSATAKTAPLSVPHVHHTTSRIAISRQFQLEPGSSDTDGRKTRVTNATPAGNQATLQSSAILATPRSRRTIGGRVMVPHFYPGAIGAGPRARSNSVLFLRLLGRLPPPEAVGDIARQPRA